MPRKPLFIELNKEAIAAIELDMRVAAKEGRLKYRRRLQIIWFSNKDWFVQAIAERFDISQSRSSSGEIPADL
jgi:hypothetical protein